MSEGTPHTPTLRRDHIIKRPRLTKLLDEADARIVLLIAPAGYGKTTLAREWLDQGGRQAVWYRCTEASADVAALALGVAAAVAELVPGAGETLRARLSVTADPDHEPEVLAQLLAADVVQWPTNHWLALEDVHLATRAGERFLGEFVKKAPVAIFITSRRRPQWATARARIYGELFQLNKSDLAMRPPETAEVLQITSPIQPDVLKTAEGWPAVIGLIALARNAQITGRLPAALYDYFAEELFRSLEPRRQWDVICLSLLPTVTRPLAEAVVGDEAARVLAAAVSAGFLDADGERLTIHPLLRSFLHAKLSEGDPSRVRAAVETAARTLIGDGRWDDAAEVITVFRRKSLLDDLLRASMIALLSDGRVSTLSRWISAQGSPATPLQMLALAEVELRAGNSTRALALAEQAHHELPPGDSFRARACYIAGFAAYLSDAYSAARRWYDLSTQSATTQRDRENAFWGRVVVTSLEEGPELATVLEQFEAVAGSDPDSRLRRQAGCFIVGMAVGLDAEALSMGQQFLSLLDQSRDPLIRTGFLNSYGRILAVAGCYEEALAVATLQIAEARRFRLGFVKPPALTTSAIAYAGLHRYGRAYACCDSAERLSSSMGDAHAFADARAARVRALIAHGRLADALEWIDRAPAKLPTRSLAAEMLCARGLIQAVRGHCKVAMALADKAASTSTFGESVALVPAIRAVASLAVRASTARDFTRAACANAHETGMWDSFVVAYRSFPQLLVEACTTEFRSEVMRIGRQARDGRLLRQHGLVSVSTETCAEPALSPREAEVYALLCRGLTNRDIAQRLYISVPTVKVHLRHVFAKLGVRNRTEAVALAASRPSTSSRRRGA